MGSIIWPIDSCYLQWPLMTLEVIRVLQDLWNAIWKKFVDISHFNWCSASCGPSAIAELLVITMPSVGERSIVMSVSIYCMPVCLCTGISQELSELHNRTLPILCLLPVVYSDWVIFWQLCYTLCTSGFVNDAIFALSRPEKCNVSGASAQSDSPVTT